MTAVFLSCLIKGAILVWWDIRKERRNASRV